MAELITDSEGNTIGYELNGELVYYEDQLKKVRK